MSVALVGAVVMGAVEAVSDKATDELSDRGNSIGHPDEAAATTTTTAPPGTGTTATTATTAPPAYTGVVEGSCTGSDGNQNECAFTLNPTPGTAAAWAINPSIGFTGTAPNVTFTTAQTRTIQATVDGSTVSRTLACTIQGSGGNLRCSLQ